MKEGKKMIRKELKRKKDNQGGKEKYEERGNGSAMCACVVRSIEGVGVEAAVGRTCFLEIRKKRKFVTK